MLEGVRSAIHHNTPVLGSLACLALLGLAACAEPANQPEANESSATGGSKHSEGSGGAGGSRATSGGDAGGSKAAAGGGGGGSEAASGSDAGGGGGSEAVAGKGGEDATTGGSPGVAGAAGAPDDEPIVPQLAPEGCDGWLEVPDPVLASWLRGYLGLEEDEPIWGPDMAELEHLLFPDAGIVDLSGLECATHLSQLYLNGNQVESVGLLSGHPTLHTLKLADNRLTSTAELFDLPNLANLELSGNPLTELEALTGMEHLFSFRVQRTAVSDLGILEQFPELDNAWFDETEVTSLESLPSHDTLRSLSISGAQLAGADFVGELPDVTFLDLSNNELDSLRGLEAESLADLETLLLSGNPISDLQPLGDFTSVGRLEIDDVGPGARDLSWLAEFASLRMFSASGNGISDIEPLTPLRRVMALNLSNNEIEDASPLEKLTYSDCALVDLRDNPGAPSFDGVADSLCERGVVVEDYCVPQGCEPCIACLY